MLLCHVIKQHPKFRRRQQRSPLKQGGWGVQEWTLELYVEQIATAVGWVAREMGVCCRWSCDVSL
jgi:hypothetical protein